MNPVQVSIGFAGLFFGTLIYLTDRPPESTYLTWGILEGFSLQKWLPDLFGTLDRSLASFLHSFSFTMISAGIMSDFVMDSRKLYAVSALFWAGVDALFEMGQYFDGTVSKWIPGGLEGVFLLETLNTYFVSGTFDGLDLMAGFAGAGFGYMVLIVTQKSENTQRKHK